MSDESWSSNHRHSFTLSTFFFSSKTFGGSERNSGVCRKYLMGATWGQSQAHYTVYYTLLLHCLSPFISSGKYQTDFF